MINMLFMYCRTANFRVLEIQQISQILQNSQRFPAREYYMSKVEAFDL